MSTRAAMNTGEGNLVHVLFTDRNGEDTGYYMNKATYDAIPLWEPATPEDYMKFGVLTPAPSGFYEKSEKTA